MSSSDYNLVKISTKELEENINATIELGGNIYIVARRGSGKSVIGKKAIQDMNCEEAYINLSVCERVDLSGLPKMFNPEANELFIKYLLPEFFRKLVEGNKPCVALLDELDKVSSDVQAALLEFTQFHTINGKPLPNLKAIIMTGNLVDEGGARPILPLLDRSEKYMVEANSTHWLDWAGKSGKIHSSITAYIADHPEDLFGDVSTDGVFADPSPRSWELASKSLFFGEQRNWSPQLLTNKVSGYVGRKVGIKYNSYYQHYQVLLPLVEKIMAGEVIPDFKRLEPSKQMVINMILASRFARQLDECKPGQKPKSTRNVANFFHQGDPEMTLIAVRSQIGLKRTVEKELDEVPEWDAILNSISKRING